MTDGGATPLKSASDHLDARARLACDRMSGGSGRGSIVWNLQDVTAVRVVLAELRPRCVVCGQPGGPYCPAHSDLGEAA